MVAASRDRAGSGPRRARLRGPLLLAAIAVLPAVLSLSALAVAWLEPANETWSHLARHVLPRAVANSVLLTLGVAFGAGALGSALAGLVTLCEFPGRRTLAWLLALPLAIPTYIIAFIYVALFDFGGALPRASMTLFGSAAWLPGVRNLPGAILVLSLVLYPYVYLLARNALVSQGGALFEAARVHGLSPTQAVLRAVLPAARPAIIAGASLAAMESLAEFGAMATLGVDTLSTTIYKTWFALGSLPAAAQLASLLLIPVALTALIERRSRRRAGFASTARRALPPIELRGAARWIAFGLPALVVFAAFALPLAQLLLWALHESRPAWAGLLQPAGHTVVIAGGAAILVVAGGGLVVGAVRWSRDARALAVLREIAGLGYAVPGTVLAVGVMIALIGLERFLLDHGIDVGFALAGSVAAVWLALLARFQRIGVGAIDAALEQLSLSLSEAAQTLGLSRAARIRRIHLPLLRPALLTGLLLAFVESMKELPATLMLRPIGWDTLAVKVYNATSEGLWSQAAVPALLLVAVGIVPTFLLFRRSL